VCERKRRDQDVPRFGVFMAQKLLAVNVDKLKSQISLD